MAVLAVGFVGVGNNTVVGVLLGGLVGEVGFSTVVGFLGVGFVGVGNNTVVAVLVGGLVGEVGF